MTSRAGKPDTLADVELRALLDGEKLKAFTLVAGAGSGKTTSIVKALTHVVSARGPELDRRAQRVACITYTDGAAQEIYSDVGSNPLAYVSTVHSFLWNIVEPHQPDIRVWVKERAAERLREKREEQASFGPRVQEVRRNRVAGDIDKLESQIAIIDTVGTFRYGVGSDYGSGLLGHEDIIQLGTDLLIERPLLQKLLAQRYPFVFVDESQDTFPEVVKALCAVKHTTGGQFCLGFIGDPMQKVYPRGAGEIVVEDAWEEIKKPENFRSPARVLDVMNHIRSQVEDMQQVSGLDADDLKDGSVRYFVLPADDARSVSLERVRSYLDSVTHEGDWTSSSDVGCKILVIAHRMAANRLGFAGLHEAFHIRDGSLSLAKRFDEGTAWPVTFLTESVLPACRTNGAEQVTHLRKNSSSFSARLASNADSARETLRASRVAVDELAGIVCKGGPGSVGAACEIVVKTGLLDIDERLAAMTATGSAKYPEPSGSVARSLREFLACDIRSLDHYADYLSGSSPYITHQGAKGAEFPRVLVVLDDEEGRHNQFSYDKLLGLKPPSITDLENKAKGNETVLERTRRLLYVCASRSTEDLTLVLYAHDVPAAVAALQESGLPGSETALTIESI